MVFVHDFVFVTQGIFFDSYTMQISGEFQLDLLLENQEHFLWNPSINFLMFLITVGGVH